MATTTRKFIRARTELIDSIGSLGFLLALLVSVQIVSAQDNNDKADVLLENLKKRSAEDRWQRIKRLYPQDAPASRQAGPARGTEPTRIPLADNELPPSPEEGPLIPRLSALPASMSNDWVIPSGQPLEPYDEEPADVVPSPGPSEEASNSPRSARPPIHVAQQVPEPKVSADDPATSNSPKVIRERKISDINPFYDRGRDQDMREYTLEKSKEFEFLTRSTTFTERCFPQVTMTWEACNIYYHPLYFADPALERYGHAHHPVIQPFASIARAGVQAAFLPYQMVIDPPWKEEYPLGYYRPGDVAPKLHYQVPLNAEAAVVQAGFVTGLYFVIP